MRKPNSTMVIFAFLLLFFLFHLPGRSAQAQNAGAPPFTVNLLEGGAVSSAELTGKLQVLKFVASY